MSDHSTMGSSAEARAGGLSGLVGTLLSWLTGLAMLVAPPVLRITLAIPFFKSGLTKWDGLALSPGALWLFQNEYKLNILGTAYPFPMPTAAAYGSAIGEIVLPILLVIGLATRFSAAGILVMTAIIQLVFPDGWTNFHLPWAAMALAIMAIGPGALSLDRLIFGRPAR